jgi:hypothetical protein
VPEETSSDLVRGWELGNKWSVQNDALYEKFVNGQSVPLQELVEFDRVIEDLTPLLEQYHDTYEKRMNWDSSEGSLPEAVKNSWSLILLSSSPCKKCGEVITSAEEAVVGGRRQDGALALMNKGLCDDCKNTQAQPLGSQSVDPYEEESTRLLKERKASVDALADNTAITNRFEALHPKWLIDAQTIVTILNRGDVPVDMLEFGTDYGELCFLLQRLPQDDLTVTANLAACQAVYAKTTHLLEGSLEAARIESSESNKNLSISNAMISVPKTIDPLTPNLPPRQSAPAPRKSHAMKTVCSNENVGSPAWRYTKVGLRTIWRLTTLLASVIAALFMAALLLLSLFMFLYQYWEGESKRGRRTGGGFESEKFFAFVNGITWLPQQMWHGLIFLVSIVFIAAVLFGESLWNVASSHVGVVAALVCLCGLATVGWVSRREWRSEFLHLPKAPTTNSWAMGLIVLVAATSALCWSYESGGFDALKTRTEKRGNQFPTADMTHDEPPIAPTTVPSEPTADSFTAHSSATSDVPSTPAPVALESPVADNGAETSDDSVVENADTESPSQESVEKAVSNWSNAFRERSAIALADCYAGTVEQYFLRSDVGHAQILSHIESTFSRTSKIRQYEISGIHVDMLPPDQSSADSTQFTRATATFNKKWEMTQTDGQIFSGEEIERLTFASSTEGWKIVREEELTILRTSRR